MLAAGERERSGRLYDLVFATWDRADPHPGADQYLLWIARDSRRIEIAQYTLRDKAGFAQGVCFYRDFRQVQGLTIPHVYWIASKPEDSRYVHRAEIAAVRLLGRAQGSEAEALPREHSPVGAGPGEVDH